MQRKNEIRLCCFTLSAVHSHKLRAGGEMSCTRRGARQRRPADWRHGKRGTSLSAEKPHQTYMRVCGRPVLSVHIALKPAITQRHAATTVGYNVGYCHAVCAHKRSTIARQTNNNVIHWQM